MGGQSRIKKDEWIYLVQSLPEGERIGEMTDL